MNSSTIVKMLCRAHVAFWLPLIFLSCTSLSMRSAAADGDACARYQQEFESRSSAAPNVEDLRVAGGVAASVTAAGAVAVAETLVYVGAGLAIGGLLCAPIIAAEAASDSRSSVGLDCLVRLSSEVTASNIDADGYSWTQRTWQSTESLRLRDHDALSELVRWGADCLMDRNYPGDAQAARRNLARLRRDAELWDHLSEFEKHQVATALVRANAVFAAGPRQPPPAAAAEPGYHPLSDPRPPESNRPYRRPSRAGGRRVTRY
ncbi:MAG: hypothetical protein K1X75_01555 [Leptospirales bacterium]|nr:hypothetical protein [Leptospirales bacterium]